MSVRSVMAAAACPAGSRGALGFARRATAPAGSPIRR